ncbi:unnamed protein product [Phytophthora fragariaefolia]|uniref:Unnamed protein product n=1 Tax=Phytophthora fragariaefolia TaxID=1490495 RepID=A0A9W6X685_9STRA|nr:unnamed protein product [Phytophthora fragariaefolia]
MLCGTFSGGAKYWAIVVKDAFAIVETCKRAEYLVRLSSAVSKSSCFHVWADLLSRWGSPFTTVATIRLESLRSSPQLDESFAWPTFEHVKVAQALAAAPEGILPDSDNEFRDTAGRIWLAAEATELCLRTCLIGHFRAAGHRTADVTFKAIAKNVFWPDLVADVKHFVARCMRCGSVSSGPPMPRPLGEALHAEKPNEIHWDYVSMGSATSGDEYVLVVKDDASHYVWLIPTVAATADLTIDALLDWFAAFGICRAWVSDQGTHFKNLVIAALQWALGAHHHLQTPRCPWANGIVEVVMRDVLRCVRSLGSEWRLPEAERPKVLKIVQLVLNQSPSVSLGGVAPVTAMTGLQAMNSLDPVVSPVDIEPISLEELRAIRGTNFEKVQIALEALTSASP